MTATPDDRHLCLPLPVTWHLCGALRRKVPPPLADTLFSIFDEAVCRTMLGRSLDADARAADGLDTLVRVYGRLRREWIEVACEAVGADGMTPLRVEALALARAAALRIRATSATRIDLEAALGDAGPVLSRFAAAERDGRPVDAVALRRLATRFDWCVTAALLGETDPCFPGLDLATPVLCAEARTSAARMRRLVEGRARTSALAAPPRT